MLGSIAVRNIFRIERSSGGHPNAKRDSANSNILPVYPFQRSDQSIIEVRSGNLLTTPHAKQPTARWMRNRNGRYILEHARHVQGQQQAREAWLIPARISE